MDELIQYYIINSELNMSPGKIAAQTAHGAVKTTEKYFHDEKHILWRNSDQKKIVLRGKQKDLEKLINNGFYPIYDNGLTEIPAGSLTVVVSPVDYKSNLKQYIKRLQLY